ncbi:alkaline phosphatase/streptomycin-6-phosphatase [Thermosporothrix hazakensis]|jgi:alkaline phosphatase/streptomycin-6-phosphatase|uniref:Alkaline phosphatase/streptomycin-6-phosphatase n=2 Tax=Thermosporothrix TaxID=768650 RepID=A0A326U7I5_THEHA|nr:alkaline phosphatase [Thermosporothrix hazakensis]PZW31139.1 alkaline phosphatase/streptomycin-6-phosphatase [Thermosporothrix hazakensis]BBH86639.1 alkaline phosphatase [Thermosporothrix sp. COM3]GCE50949.1 alkaline phosphatase [Thermosporothrix hazakensis]
MQGKKQYFSIGISVLVLLLLLIPTAAFARTSVPETHGRYRNVILFLGDGMGDSEITLARNYFVGANGRLNMDKLPYVGASTTYSVLENNPKQPDYVTDSAASGTGWATGTKTSNGRISTTAGTDKDLPTILELAQKAGYVTGDVTTAELTDATPAVLASHVSSRSCQGPADMKSCPQDKKSAGGPGSIAEQQIDHQVNVLLGGGKQRFDQKIDFGKYTGKTVLEAAQAQGYTVVTDANGLKKVNSQHVLGLFNQSNMTTEWTGTPAQPFPGSGPQTCQENNRPSNEPALADMTSKAIELLQRNSRKGFFLQVEGASIDKQDHAANPCAQIGETIAFDKAIKVGMDYARQHPDTLVIVTADHGHTSQIIEEPTSAKQPGVFSKLITKEGSTMYVSYATAPSGESQSHTGTQVRIAAMGPEAPRVMGVINQTDIFQIIKRALSIR